MPRGRRGRTVRVVAGAVAPAPGSPVIPVKGLLHHALHIEAPHIVRVGDLLQLLFRHDAQVDGPRILDIADFRFHEEDRLAQFHGHDAVRFVHAGHIFVEALRRHFVGHVARRT